MQIVESTDFFLRTGVFYLKNKNPDIQLEFMTIPMFHIGTLGFYREVREKLEKCDIIFYEGIDFKRGEMFGICLIRLPKNLI